MAKVIAGMTMSLDGYVADVDGRVDALYADLEDLQGSEYMARMQAETGAVLMGRRTFDMTPDPDAYADDYEFQVPIVVLTHEPPERQPKGNDQLSVMFVTEGLHPALDVAREHAGDRAVTVVGGIDVVRQLFINGLVDELHMDVAPVLLGGGRRLLDGIGPADLELISTEQVGQRSCLRFRTARSGS